VGEWKTILDECRRRFAPRPTPAGVIVPRDWESSAPGTTCRGTSCVGLEPRPSGGWNRTVRVTQKPLQPGRDLFQESRGLTVVIE
jgi:hypothetical protein